MFLIFEKSFNPHNKILSSLNFSVVKALEILYMDYLPLRVAGDLIFKLVNKVLL